MHSLYSANKLKLRPTGNAGRGSYQTQPGISPNNFYIAGGRENPKNLISRISDGVYVTRIMGAHTANPISGDFSYGIQGLLIENGEKTRPVRGITVAGNVIDLLKAVSAVGNDLKFISSVGSPTLVVEGIAVGGH
jgi:PmbA protein